MTIEDFLRLLLRNALLLVLLTVLGAAAGYGFSYTKAPVYQASALGFVRGAAGSDPVNSTQGQYSKAQFFLPLFQTRAVGQTIVDELGMDASPDAVAGSLATSLDPNAPIITVTASAGSPEEASAIANASIEAVAAEAEKLEPGTGSQLVPYQTALTPGVPVSPDRIRYAAVGAAAGLLAAMALAVLRNRNDSRLRTVDQLADEVNVPVLGVLPDVKDFSRPKSGILPEPKTFQAREALRKFRTNLRFVDVDNPPRSIVVTSSAPAEGKSVVSGNLSRVIAGTGQPTLLIDADLRRPQVAKQFGLDGSVGLSQLLAGAVSVEDVVQPIPGTRLSVLPAGQIPPNPSELLGSRRMHELIKELSRTHFVVIDAPPVLAVTDAQLLSRHADGAVLVAVTGRTRVEGLRRAIDSIHNVSGKVFGVVLNRASTSRLKRIAYGDAEYGYSPYGDSSKRYAYGSAAGLETGPAAELEVPDDVISAPVPETLAADEDPATEHGHRARGGKRAAAPDEDDRK
ncbi:capsular exopolysaccharide synthesis family protein [Brachybacterium muris]|uniref:polysaccharide biosynthesis tyrosine autokinase n=1 Tax=Brachybacterium muris TaxID=219301 RepID=UPI001958D3E1|nr:capsular exopolysaccharide synthesis family protein [Brachybacterium muris]